MLGRWWKIAGASFLLASAAAPQDLAPEVLLLSRIKRHLRDELAHVPNYTCLETISRFQNRAHTPLMPLDTVRLEIVYTDRREWYGSPGARNLTVENPVAFIGAGMIGNGAFALMLNNLLEGGIFTYRGDESVSGRAAVKYDFRLPRLLKTLTISVPGGSGTAGEEGSLWADKESLDLIRVESRAVEIPPDLPVAEASTNVDYARMRIGENDVLLAQQADSHMLDANGVESYNRLEFTHCRAYSAISDVTFDLKPVEPAQQASPPDSTSVPSPKSASPAIPALLRVIVQLTTSISDKDSVGTLIEGRISGDVVRKGKIVIPDGSLVRGRIRRLDRYQGGEAFIVGLEFTEVELPGGSAPFYADLLSIDKSSEIQPVLSQQNLVPGDQARKQTITLAELPGVASFIVKGASFTLSTGLHTVWRTRGPIR
jgi:hypothetical protein